MQSPNRDLADWRFGYGHRQKKRNDDEKKEIPCSSSKNRARPKTVLRQPWNALTLQLLLSLRDNLTNKIVLSFCKFISPEARVINLFAILQVSIF